MIEDVLKRVQVKVRGGKVRTIKKEKREKDERSNMCPLSNTRVNREKKSSFLKYLCGIITKNYVTI